MRAMYPTEQRVMDALVEAWNAWLKLGLADRDDQDDFRRAIHEAQRILMARVYAREHPQRFRCDEVGQAGMRLTGRQGVE